MVNLKKMYKIQTNYGEAICEVAKASSININFVNASADITIDYYLKDGAIPIWTEIMHIVYAETSPQSQGMYDAIGAAVNGFASSYLKSKEVTTEGQE